MKRSLITMTFLISFISFEVMEISGQSGQFCTISGSVFDQHNKPLPFANVFLKGQLEGSVSDNQGNFTFKTRALGKATLICSHIGY